MHATSNNLSALYVINIDITFMLQIQYLRFYFWLVGQPLLKLVQLKIFLKESILECPALDVRQLGRNKKRKKIHNLHIHSKIIYYTDGL